MGVQLRKTFFAIKEGNNVYPFNISDYNAGIYTVSLKDESGKLIEYKKVIKK